MGFESGRYPGIGVVLLTVVAIGAPLSGLVISIIGMTRPVAIWLLLLPFGLLVGLFAVASAIAGAVRI